MPADMVLTPLEIRILAAVDGLAEDAPARPLGEQLRSIARLGGYLDRKNDGPPGNMVMWRGLNRLHDIQLGVELGAGLVGN